MAAASEVIPVAGLFFTAWQLRILNGQARHDRRVALDGVVVSWLAVQAPDHADADGTGQWLYEFAAHNPGTLPIDNVVVRWHFPCEVERIRYSGRRGAPTRTLTFRAPVIPGGEHRAWKRRLRIAFACAADLKSTYAEISFVDIDGKPHKNRWPREITGQLSEHEIPEEEVDSE